ncbi:zinc finger protein 692-like isoform X3 [Lathamus discolor]|uniref:zinc finger protein 692-like isoform X3 n=1 Tax=Lathamus discolor TaxID=678569 RepID=UPI0032B70B68
MSPKEEISPQNGAQRRTAARPHRACAGKRGGASAILSRYLSSPLPMDPGRPARQRAPDCIRRQKRRELDARRSKCRIRIGGHLERWCRLKEQLGFALHSQLAQFLLDRYSSHGCVWSPGEPGPGLLHAEALQRLVVLSHGHGQECGFVPDVKAPAPGSAAPLVWECVAGHSFSWGVPGSEEEPGGDPGGSGRRRSLRRAGNGEPGAEGEAPAPAPGQREEPGAGAGDGAAPQVPAETGTAGKDHGSALIPEEKVKQGPEPQEEEEEEEEEDLAEDDDLTYTDDLRDENYHPSMDSESEPQRRPSQGRVPRNPIKEEQPPDELSLSSSSPPEERSGRASCKRRARASDEDVAQIGPKRIRKAAKREILLCDFEGCGKIFSNRQYLNHHKKYQHVHQKTFTCSEPSCGKSFNFKKHLKEHEKLHSDKRDYICEFCARSFRTSSNLIIHRRIHTGEKPLQCEVCGFTCRQKASLNWHMKKHGAAAGYQFSCELCGKRFEKRDNVAAHKSKSHPPGERPAPPAPAPTEGPAPGATLGSGGDPEQIPPPVAEYREGIGIQDAGAAQGQGMEGAGS